MIPIARPDIDQTEIAAVTEVLPERDAGPGQAGQGARGGLGRVRRRQARDRDRQRDPRPDGDLRRASASARATR